MTRHDFIHRYVSESSLWLREKYNPVDQDKNKAMLEAIIECAEAAADLLNERYPFDDEQQKKETLYDWSKAPEWAEWAATDNDSASYWYSEKPNKMDDSWAGSNGIGQKHFLRPDLAKDWENSLEERPK